MGGSKPDKSGNCEICGIWRQVLCRDRRIPGHLGGTYDPSNVQWICANCHQDKTALEMSAVHKGRRKSPEHRAKLSAWQVGKKLSAKTKEKIRQSVLARYAADPEYAETIGQKARERYKSRDMWNKGQPQTEEVKTKISESLTKYFDQHPELRSAPWRAQGISKTTYYRRLHRANETPEQAEERRAAKRAYYHAHGDTERATMRARYRRRRDAQQEPGPPL